MRILYVTPRIIGEGGLVRVLSIKANYFADVFGYEVHILTQNDNHIDPFYHFSEAITFHNMQLSGNRVRFLKQYIQSVKALIAKIQPDLVVVCDGLKGFFIPIFIQTEIPILFESHGSIFNTESKPRLSMFYNLGIKFKKYAASKFDKFIVLSEDSQSEWQVSNRVVIPNPNWLSNVTVSDLSNKKVLVVARHSYEKGIDRLLEVWNLVAQKHPDWILEVYGSFEDNYYQKQAQQLGLTSIHFYQPVSNIEEQYSQSSMLLMTSRYEGFPMVLIEAMTFGLPCVAFDCPCGPRAIIENNETGFLIEDHNIQSYADKVIQLIEDRELALKMSANAVKLASQYDLETIMTTWNELLKSLMNK